MAALAVYVAWTGLYELLYKDALVVLLPVDWQRLQICSSVSCSPWDGRDESFHPHSSTLSCLRNTATRTGGEGEEGWREMGWRGGRGKEGEAGREKKGGGGREGEGEEEGRGKEGRRREGEGRIYNLQNTKYCSDWLVA